VAVTENGFEYAGTTFPLLTKIAHAITGPISSAAVPQRSRGGRWGSGGTSDRAGVATPTATWQPGESFAAFGSQAQHKLGVGRLDPRAVRDEIIDCAGLSNRAELVRHRRLRTVPAGALRWPAAAAGDSARPRRPRCRRPATMRVHCVGDIPAPRVRPAPRRSNAR
jgi:hypothetical protein